MYFDKSARKKTFRPRGTRGGRRKKGSAHGGAQGNNYEVSTYQNNSLDEELHSKSLYYHPNNSINNNSGRYHQVPQYTANEHNMANSYPPVLPPPMQFVPQQSINYVNILPPPPPLMMVNSYGSYSSHSTNDSHMGDSSYSGDSNHQRMHYQGSYQHFVNDKPSIEPSQPIQRTVQKKPMPKIETTHADSWTSLFSISPRSFLMGDRGN
jgi:hypothetical protein